MTELCLILFHSTPPLCTVEQFLRTVRPTTVRATVIWNSFVFNLRTKCKEEIFIIPITKVCMYSIRLVEFLCSVHFPLMDKQECVGCPPGNKPLGCKCHTPASHEWPFLSSGAVGVSLCFWFAFSFQHPGSEYSSQPAGPLPTCSTS